MSHRYRIYGLVLASERPLPLIPASGDSVADAMLSFGAIPPSAVPCIRSKPHFELYADGACAFRAPEGLRFRVEGGRHIRADVPEGAEPGRVQAWLLGTAMALLLFQRGDTPLHASAITLPGGAVAIAGDSGAGKSSTARALLGRGHGLLSDDLVLVRPRDALVQPGLPSLRLFRHIATFFGDAEAQATAWTPDEEKLALDRSDRFDPSPQPLRAVFFLETRPGAAPRAEPLPAAAAVPLLHRNVFRRRLASFIGHDPQIFAWASALAATIPCYRLFRPDDLDRIDELATCIEAVVR